MSLLSPGGVVDVLGVLMYWRVHSGSSATHALPENKILYF